MLSPGSPSAASGLFEMAARNQARNDFPRIHLAQIAEQMRAQQAAAARQMMAQQSSQAFQRDMRAEDQRDALADQEMRRRLQQQGMKAMFAGMGVDAPADMTGMTPEMAMPILQRGIDQRAQGALQQLIQPHPAPPTTPLDQAVGRTTGGAPPLAQMMGAANPFGQPTGPKPLTGQDILSRAAGMKDLPPGVVKAALDALENAQPPKPTPPRAWQPSTMSEAVDFEKRVAEAREGAKPPAAVKPTPEQEDSRKIAFLERKLQLEKKYKDPKKPSAPGMLKMRRDKAKMDYNKAIEFSSTPSPASRAALAEWETAQQAIDDFESGDGGAETPEAPPAPEPTRGAVDPTVKARFDALPPEEQEKFLLKAPAELRAKVGR